ncbi:MAG: tRNA 5-methoxyuridine(34)/uridine 5-oxyacetic acid(34) synthase CmoB [Xanthomonadales bacterium]|nr:tRNA 5-methoxyuridine(34)/uridine 5-oxyacetic acid(34) synthase CmoB [Xanthomonadales bacterium]
MQLEYALSEEALGDLAAELSPLIRRCEVDLKNPRHGDFPRWKAVLDALPLASPATNYQQAAVLLGEPCAEQNSLKDQLMGLHPWRKGPFTLGGIDIDCEWRSDWKWDRLAPHLGSLQDQRILDIGCGNGYFGWRMLGAGAKQVIGIDPSLLFVMQYFACQHFAGTQTANVVLPLGIEDLPETLSGFDRVFSMGVFYHRRSPVEHLLHLHRLCKPGGQVILETLVIKGDENQVLVPANRYARMRNVWFLPSSEALLNLIRRAGFKTVECVDETTTSIGEQRSTEWMQFESFAESLQATDNTKTIEGYPAPRRAIFIASK